VSDSIIQALPDLVAFVRRDGLITQNLGGRQLQGMPNVAELVGRRLDEVWPEPVAKLLHQMLRRALADRAPVEGRYVDGSRSYEARFRPQGRERVLCIIREVSNAVPAGTNAKIERRGFLHAMSQSIAAAALREQPLSLCMIHLGGLAEVGQSMDFTIADEITRCALQRLPVSPADAPGHGLGWYVGQLCDGLVAVVIHGTTERELVRSTVQTLCNSLAAPVSLGGASFYLAPCAGIAILGQDAVKPKALLEHARAALSEARRSGSGALHFYSDTLRLMPQVRLDMERELRRAIASDQFDLRYVGRHDLASGRLEAVQAYLRWRHPLRGEIHPAEFLPMAASTGLTVAVSRCALGRLRSDSPALRNRFGPTVKFSFGPLRHHLVADEFIADIDGLFQSSGIAPDMIELRIAEKTLASLGKAERVVGHLAGIGTGVVIEEFGRGFSSLARLAQLPLLALQIDRHFVVSVLERPSALRFCRGAIALARSYGLTPIAAGIDSEAARQQFLEFGCEHGLGDCFAPIDLSAPAASGAASATG
jgi:predicted signal transduction protein with EAL and GGDEF domain